MRRADSDSSVPAPTRLRLDKWLWAARFFKTRSLATAAIEAGQVRVGDERIKPAHTVRVGERVTVRKAGLVWDVEVTGLSERRGPASAAAALYREDEGSIAARATEIARRRAAFVAAAFPGRPTKRDRRRLEDFLDEP